MLNLTRAIGVSNYEPADLDALDFGGVIPAVNQFQWSIEHHSDDQIEYCLRHGIVPESYFTMKGCPFDNAAVKTIAAAHNASVSRVCLRYILEKGGAIACGTGSDPASTSSYAKENLDIYDFSLSADEMNILDQIGAGLTAGVGSTPPTGGDVPLGTIVPRERSALSGAGVASTPPMGWNSWYALGKAAGWPSTNETTVLATAHAMRSLSLVDAGYSVLVIDDSWETGHREPDGTLVANPAKFPSGMADLSKQLSSLGLNLGLYTTPGNYTCAGADGGGEPGSYGHVEQDIQTWVGEWGVRYIKNCVCNTTKELRTHAYADMGRAINATGAAVVYECDPFMDEPWKTLDNTCNL